MVLTLHKEKIFGKKRSKRCLSKIVKNGPGPGQEKHKVRINMKYPCEP